MLLTATLGELCFDEFKEELEEFREDKKLVGQIKALGLGIVEAAAELAPGWVAAGALPGEWLSAVQSVGRPFDSMWEVPKAAPAVAALALALRPALAAPENWMWLEPVALALAKTVAIVEEPLTDAALNLGLEKIVYVFELLTLRGVARGASHLPMFDGCSTDAGFATILLDRSLQAARSHVGLELARHPQMMRALRAAVQLLAAVPLDVELAGAQLWGGGIPLNAVLARTAAVDIQAEHTARGELRAVGLVELLEAAAKAAFAGLAPLCEHVAAPGGRRADAVCFAAGLLQILGHVGRACAAQAAIEDVAAQR